MGYIYKSIQSLVYLLTYSYPKRKQCAALTWVSFALECNKFQRLIVRQPPNIYWFPTRCCLIVCAWVVGLYIILAYSIDPKSRRISARLFFDPLSSVQWLRRRGSKSTVTIAVLALTSTTDRLTCHFGTNRRHSVGFVPTPILGMQSALAHNRQIPIN